MPLGVRPKSEAMDFETLKTLGQIAGIGGLCVGMVILVFKRVITARFLSRLTPDQSFKLLMLMTVGVFLVALVGVGGWVFIASKQTSLPLGALPPQTNSLPVNSSTVANLDARTRELLDAILKGDTNKVSALLAQGANPNAKDAHGQTPLHYAAANNRPEITRLLLNSGARADATNNVGVTPGRIATSLKFNRVATMIGTNTPPHR